ncbi:DUF4416 family protein [Bacteriovorax sp. DB6_IX]|uniref:DUF4416 family protein n=1 Tax=Bacteriovorax sp. DB6_IX TaxID=1353530 RepID=UPI000389FABF|nr:DUF4416 family protein [Bacteriovorax sp. DB6_IX]EQC49707.1 PF14385 domain protein [Bacteriovorax sp. DB6_IX]
MSKLSLAEDVLFFHSVLFNKAKISLESLRQLCLEYFGESILLTHPFFPMKQYYSKEMGSEDQLERVFFFYPKKASRESLVAMKTLSTELENKYSNNGQRIFNLDSGYISKDQVLLATGKPYSHRIYLAGGVYGELTYRYCGKSFEKLDWTYPDYSHPEIIQKFNWLREVHFTRNLLD